MSVVSEPSSMSSEKVSLNLHLLVAMPALNEAATIANVIASIPEQIEGFSKIDVLVIDDGCTDDTAAIAKRAGAFVVHHPESRGVGAAFHSALAFAIEKKVDVLVTIDSDGQFDPNDIPKLTQPVISDQADFVTASRFKDPELVPVMPWIKKWGNRQMSRLISRLTKQEFADVSCGMRCYGRRAMATLNPQGAFTYTQEVFLNLAFKHMRIAEVPIPVRGVREVGKSRVARSLWQYGINTLRIIFRVYRDFRPMQFFGGLALLLLVPGILLGGFFGIHYLMTGQFSPYKWTGFTAGGLFVLSLILLHMGMLGDMLNRHRIYLEELLYTQRISKSPDRTHQE